MVVKYTAKLDLTDNGTFNTGWRIKQGDFRDSVIVVKVANNGEPYFNASDLPSIVFHRADGKSIIGKMSAGSNESYQYALVGNELEIAGLVVMDVKFGGSNTGRTSTASCTFTCVEDTLNPEATPADIYPGITLEQVSTEATTVATSVATEVASGVVSELREDVDANTAAIEELESKPTSAMLLESTSPLEYATNNNIVGLYTKGKSEQSPIITMGSLNWQKSSSGNGRFYADIANGVPHCVLTCSKYPYADSHNYVSGKICSGDNGNGLLRVFVVDTAYATADAFKSGNASVTIGYEGTPTPTNPIPIKDASGVVEAHTPNMVDFDSIVLGKSWNDDTNAARGYVELDLEVGKTYTASTTSYNGLSTITIMLINGDGVGDSRRLEINSQGRYEVTFTYESRFVRARLLFVAPSGTLTKAMCEPTNPMLEQGTTASPYVPYKSNSIFIGENRYDNSKIEKGAITSDKGEETTSDTNYRTPFIPIASPFTLSRVGGWDSAIGIRVTMYDANKKFISSDRRTVLPATFNVNNVRYVRINSSNLDENLRLVVNDSPLNSIDLRSIPNTNIADTLTVNEDGSAEWVQKVGYSVVDGSIDATISGWANQNSTVCIYWVNDGINYNNSGTYIVSDKFIGVSRDYCASTDTECICMSGGTAPYNPALRVLKSRIANWSESDSSATKMSKIKAWLNSNNVTMYYPLATPIVHTLTKEQVDAIRQLKTYDGTTLIDAELANVRIKYAGDTKKYVDDGTRNAKMDAIKFAVEYTNDITWMEVNNVTSYASFPKDAGSWYVEDNLDFKRRVFSGTVSESATQASGQELWWVGVDEEIITTNGHVGTLPLNIYISENGYARVDWRGIVVTPQGPQRILRLYASANCVGNKFDIIVEYTKSRAAATSLDDTPTTLSLDDADAPAVVPMNTEEE